MKNKYNKIFLLGALLGSVTLSQLAKGAYEAELSPSFYHKVVKMDDAQIQEKMKTLTGLMQNAIELMQNARGNLGGQKRHSRRYTNFSRELLALNTILLVRLSKETSTQ